MEISARTMEIYLYEFAESNNKWCKTRDLIWMNEEKREIY
jgi:hypothetical protein